MRIFLDASIVFAACWSDGAIRKLLRELRAQDHSLIVDDYVLGEARRNLAAKSRDGMRELDLLMTASARIGLGLERAATLAVRKINRADVAPLPE